jgi:hypothetical protein
MMQPLKASRATARRSVPPRVGYFGFARGVIFALSEPADAMYKSRQSAQGQDRKAIHTLMIDNEVTIRALGIRRT